MAGSYIPLIGSENIVSILDAAAAAMVAGTISGVAPSGRSGSLKTSVLIALDGASTPDVPATASALLCSVTVACPPGFVTATGNFDYTEILPEVSASVVCGGFLAPAGAWPLSLGALITAEAAFPANLVSIVGRLTAITVPTTPWPYGTLTFAFTGAASTAAIANALLAVSINFGSSVAN